MQIIGLTTQTRVKSGSRQGGCYDGLEAALPQAGSA